MDIKTLSINDLKALAYDNLAIIENAQKNIKAINEELVNRHKTDETPDKELQK